MNFRTLLALKGYDYWALGHIHQRQVLGERPWIVFSGNLQGRHVRETGPKGCTLVTVDDGRITAVEHRAVDVLRWAVIEVDATDADVGTLTDRISQAVAAETSDADGRPVLARIIVSGQTGLHERVCADEDGLAAAARDCANAAGGTLHVEKVQVRTRALGTEAEGYLAPLRAAFAAGLDDPETVAGLLRDLADLRRKLPAEIHGTVQLPDTVQSLRAFADVAWAVAADAMEMGQR